MIDAGPIIYWLPGLVCLLGLGELPWRSRRLVVAFGVGHVGAVAGLAGASLGMVVEALSTLRRSSTSEEPVSS